MLAHPAAGPSAWPRDSERCPKRGAGDPLYGYYTMGKLAILKLRDDYKATQGTAFSLQDFHDTQ